METLTMEKSSVIQTPKETILEGVITKASKGTWRDVITDVEKLSKFEKPEQELVILEIDCKYETYNFKVTDRFAYYDKPMSNSNLGKFLLKYGELKEGVIVKVDFDTDGFAKVRL